LLQNKHALQLIAEDSLILEKCVICQKSGRETVVSFTDHSKSRFFDAVDRRKDEIYALFVTFFAAK
jgi:hypothetical protein